MPKLDRNLVAGVVLLPSAALLVSFLVALQYSKGGEVAAALGAILGGIIGAGGAATAVYLTLSAQREEDQKRVNLAIKQEVIGLCRLVAGHLGFCRMIGMSFSVQRDKLPLLMHIPAPTIFPAVAGRIGLTTSPQLVTHFYALLLEAQQIVRVIAEPPEPQSKAVDASNIQKLTEALRDICQFGKWIIEDKAVAGDLFEASIISTMAAAVSEVAAHFDIKLLE